MNQMREAIERIRISSDKVRRGLYARNNKIESGFEDLSNRLAIIERSICREH